MAVRDSLPKDTLPKDTLPKDTLPKDTLPKDSLPKDSLPKDTLPTLTYNCLCGTVEFSDRLEDNSIALSQDQTQNPICRHWVTWRWLWM